MKKFLTFLALACFMVAGAWAQWTPPFEAASSYAGITHWYALNAHSNQTHYLYTDGGAIKHNDLNYETSDNYAWGFVGNDTDGYTIYNKATGDAVALDSSDPCALTAAGLSVKWTVNQSTETSEKGRKGFCFKVSGQSYVNYQGGNLARWNSTDAGSTFTPYELDFNTKTYTIHITGAPVGTKVTYNSNQYADGDTFSAAGVSSSEITPDPVTGYTFNISISGTDINVEYSLPPLTGMSDIVEGRVYTLESVDRGYFVYSSTYADGYISGSKRAGYNFNAADENFHFVFLQNGGKTYLYSLGADKFVAYASDGLVTSEKAPTAGIALLASTGASKATHPTVLRIDDSHQCNMSNDQGKGILTNWNSTADNGNMLRILPVDELTAEELAAIKEVFNQKQDFTVTITGAPAGTEVTYKEEKYGNGEVISAASVSKEEITPDNVEGYKAEVTVNGTNITVAYYELLKTNQLYVLSTKNRGAWVVEGEDFMSTANASVGKDIDPTDAYQLFAIYEYDGAYYLWNEGAQHFINNAGTVVGIQSASPIAWSEEAGGTYFFHFTDEAEKYININGSKAMDICYWSFADEGNMMHLTPVEGFDADAVEAVINADFNEKTYTVTVTGATDGRLIYDGNEYANEDTFKAAGLNSTDISAKELLGYQSSVSMNGTEITVTYTAINYSFEISQAPVNEEWQVGTKFYSIKEKRNGYFYASELPDITTKTAPSTDDGKWAVIANGTHVQFMNKATQEVLTFAGAANDAQADMTGNLNDPYSLFDVVTYKNAIFEGGFECFKIAGEVAYPNDKSGKLAIWNSEQALWGWGGSQASPKNGDDGSKFQFALVETFGEANWAGLAELVATAKSYTVGAGLGQYSWIVYDEDYTSDWAESLEFYEGCVEAQDGDADFVDFLIESLNEAIGQLQLNLPKPNTFLRVKGAASGNYIAGDNSISNGRAGMTADKDASSILYYTEDGELIGYQSGLGFIDTFHRATVGSTFEHHTFSASSYGNKGAYTLESDFANGSKVFYDGTTDVNRNSAANSVNCAWYLEEVTELPVTVTSAGYATLYAPVNLTIPTGVKAYGMTVANEKYLSPEEIDTTIPANTGVVLEAAADTYNFAITEGTVIGTSDLTGTCATIASAETDGNYVFSIKDGTPGFYKFVGSELKGFKAYYQTSVASINGFSIDFGGQTVGVNSVISATNLKAGYDIQGRMINKMQKGINVINGKKIIK